MATILTKKSDTASAVPLAADLTNAAGGAELAVNATDKRLFSKTSGGTVVELGTNPTAMAVVGNTTVGGTLGVTGATTLAGVSATTLSASSTVTLSGGTANGVAYLNGSKVVTSGSALTFDGTTLTATTQMATGTTGTAGKYLLNRASDGAAAVSLGLSSNDFSANNGAGGGYIFNISSTEQMRLTSTGLGIGTSSPQAKLQVLNTIKVSSADQSSGNVILGDGGSTSFNVGIARWNGSTNAAGTGGMGYFAQGPTNSGGHFWYTGDASAGSTTKQMTLDTSGNLGLGVTPSAWDGALKAIQVNTQGVFASETSAVHVMTNVYYNSGYKYIGTGYATDYYQYNGLHAWRTASSGTAGNAITFTQAMTLTAAGNLGVGVTSPTNKIDLGFTDTTIGWYLSASYSAGISYNSGARSMTLATKSADSADFIAFSTGTSATERARIDSSGNLLVGTTNNAPRDFTSGSGGSKLPAPGSPLEIATSDSNCVFINQLGTGSITSLIAFRQKAVGIGSISYNGSSVLYNASSDYRLKNITGALTGYKERLMSLQPKQGTWKADGSEFRGFLAHEFAQPYRASVSGEKDAVDAEGKPVMQAMQASSSEVMADLVALVQEQQAIINSLKARLDAANL